MTSATVVVIGGSGSGGRVAELLQQLRPVVALSSRWCCRVVHRTCAQWWHLAAMGSGCSGGGVGGDDCGGGLGFGVEVRRWLLFGRQ
jgi:hypothetical protein